MTVPNDFPCDVFLSHSAKDKAVVRAVAERLRVAVRKHLKVWFDEWVLKPGDSIPAKIEEGLEHSRSVHQPLAFSLQPLFRAFGSDWAKLKAGTCGRRNLRFRDLHDQGPAARALLDGAGVPGAAGKVQIGGNEPRQE
jgi:hypothetical protein